MLRESGHTPNLFRAPHCLNPLHADHQTNHNLPLTGLRELAISLSKLSTPLGRDSEEIKEGGSKRISNQSLASFKKRNIFLLNTTSLDISI
jgi:hypothetical protein